MNMNIWVLLQMVDLEIVTANRKVYELRWVKPKVKTPPSWGTRFACRSTEATTYSMLNVIFFGLFLDSRWYTHNSNLFSLHSLFSIQFDTTRRQYTVHKPLQFYRNRLDFPMNLCNTEAVKSTNSTTFIYKKGNADDELNDITPCQVWHTWASDWSCSWGIQAIFARLPF